MFLRLWSLSLRRGFLLSVWGWNSTNRQKVNVVSSSASVVKLFSCSSSLSCTLFSAKMPPRKAAVKASSSKVEEAISAPEVVFTKRTRNTTKDVDTKIASDDKIASVVKKIKKADPVKQTKTKTKDPDSKSTSKTKQVQEDAVKENGKAVKKATKSKQPAATKADKAEISELDVPSENVPSNDPEKQNGKPVKKTASSKKPAATKKVKESQVEKTSQELEKPTKKTTAKKPATKTTLAPGPNVTKQRGTRKAKEDAVDESSEKDEPVDDAESKKKTAKGRTAKKRGAAEPDDEVESKKAKNSTETDWKAVGFSCTRENGFGKPENFHITCWNVDGIRAWLKKGGLDIIEHDHPDILCLQETKCSVEKIPPEIKGLDGYKTYWHCSQKEGYAGVGICSKIMPIEVFYGINDEEQDGEGRCITAEYKKFYLVNVYVPNAGRKLVTLPKRLDWNKSFKAWIKSLDAKKPVIICGDMNVAHHEIDLANPKTNTKNAGFTKEEREGMTDFLGEGFVDTFRQLYPNRKDAYTFWTYLNKARAKNVGWRLDYFLLSERFTKNVCDNVIREKVLGSDHCPITLYLNI